MNLGKDQWFDYSDGNSSMGLVMSHAMTPGQHIINKTIVAPRGRGDGKVGAVRVVSH